MGTTNNPNRIAIAVVINIRQMHMRGAAGHTVVRFAFSFSFATSADTEPIGYVGKNQTLGGIKSAGSLLDDLGRR
jgi:hypothetical protein